MTSPSTSARLLLVDDESTIRVVFGKELARAGFVVETAEDAASARRLLDQAEFDLVVLDVRLPGMSGEDFLREVVARDQDLPVIILTGHANVDLAVELMRSGARDLLTKPCTIKHLTAAIERALEVNRVRQTARSATRFLRAGAEPPTPVFQSESMRRLLDLASRIAATDEPVLLKGESGTGKEVIAHHIQRRSRRASGPFIAVNCAAVSSTLLESELFGHEKGAFSGAVDRRIGFFEMADGGTIFLDEIGDMAPGMQAKLLRVLQSGEFWRVGGSRPLLTNVRVVAATNRDLEDLIRAGEFREDLHFRINAITLTIPPLRERREDIALLARHFLAEVPARASGTTFGPEALRELDAYAWPGNVRELRNVVRRAALLAGGPEIEVGDLMLPVAAPRSSPDQPQPAPDLSRPLDEIEREYILAVLSDCGGNKAKAARVLGIAVKTIYNKLEAWGLGGPE